MDYATNKFVGKKAKLLGAKISDLLPLFGFSMGFFFVTMLISTTGLAVGWLYLTNLGITLFVFLALRAMDFRAKAAGKVAHPSFLASGVSHLAVPRLIAPDMPLSSQKNAHHQENIIQ